MRLELDNRSQTRIEVPAHGPITEIELPVGCRSWQPSIIQAIGKELQEMFEHSPLALDQHDDHLKALMLFAALRKRYPESKPEFDLADLHVSMNEDLSCTVESHIKFIDVQGCGVVSQPFSVTVPIDLQTSHSSSLDDIPLDIHIKRHYRGSDRYWRMTMEDFAKFAMVSEQQALQIARSVQKLSLIHI